MKKLAIVGFALLATACTRIETGEVGLRIGVDKQVKMEELLPGSLNQVMFGDVLVFPIKDVRLDIENKNPITRDNTPLSDFDISVVYSINPKSVGEIYTTKSKAFHELDAQGNTYLMASYLRTIINNASYKAVRQREALKVVDDRSVIEAEIKAGVEEQLSEENMAGSILISQVMIRNIQPNQAILNSALNVINQQNNLLAKDKEVEIAKKEAERVAALNSNSKAIEYMNAQAQLEIAQAVAAGKVNTIVIPYDFKGIVNLK